MDIMKEMALKQLQVVRRFNNKPEQVANSESGNESVYVLDALLSYISVECQQDDTTNKNLILSLIKTLENIKQYNNMAGSQLLF